MRETSRHFKGVACTAVLAASAFGVLAPSAGAASKAKKPAGVIYTETNDLKSNAIVVFDRDSKGKLTQRQIVKTGGKGSTQDVGCGTGCLILDSSGSVDSNGKLVFAVNAGSDTVTSFKETGSGLKKVSTAPSGGDLPISVTSYKGLLYVLNTNDGTISGLKYTSSGKLTPIPNSTQTLFAAGGPGPSGASRQISFDRTGKTVVVDELGPGFITTFPIGAGGAAGPATPPPHASAVPFPFGFAFTPDNTLILSEIVDGSGTKTGMVSSYSYDTATGTPTVIDTKDTGGVLPCWVSITPDGSYAYVINTGAGMPAGAAKFAIESDGKLTSKGVTLAPTGTFAWTDPAQSADGKYLYVLAPGVMPGVKGHIDSYKISASGGLKFLGSTKKNLATGVSGLDGR
jgi:6-phosphogluconolactonase